VAEWFPVIFFMSLLQNDILKDRVPDNGVRPQSLLMQLTDLSIPNVLCNPYAAFCLKSKMKRKALQYRLLLRCDGVVVVGNVVLLQVVTANDKTKGD